LCYGKPPLACDEPKGGVLGVSGQEKLIPKNSKGAALAAPLNGCAELQR